MDSSPASTPASRPDQRSLKRASVACRRCRRLRTKCINDGLRNPCNACQKLGPALSRECAYPNRGEKDIDREYRHSRGQPGAAELPESINRRGSMQARFDEDSDWGLLPPLADVVEACKYFTSSYFQLGFLPKAVFFDRLSRDPRSISVFFLLSVLSVSARFTPCLVASYGSGVKATEIFMQRASKMVLREMYKPSLERVQAFFLLAVAQWGHGDKNHSSMHMGIAVRMAGMLRLHKEETYFLPQDATGDEIVSSEMARRTFWMIASQDNLHSGPNTPASFSLSDVTALLPCEEHDFAFGNRPHERAALAGTHAATESPELTSSPSRSLFATLIQAHDLWGQVSRRACRRGHEAANSDKPWESTSHYSKLARALKSWEADLPRKHRWSGWNLLGYKAESLDLAYLSIVMVLRLSNIVLRSIYLEDMMTSSGGSPIASRSETSPRFWETTIDELFDNVLGLHEQIQTYFPHRSQDEGFPPIIVFCVYICGTIASYLWKWPQLCPRLSPQAESILQSSLSVLESLQHAWPMASRWQNSLQKAASAHVTENGINSTHTGNSIPANYAPPLNNGVEDIEQSQIIVTTNQTVVDPPPSPRASGMLELSTIAESHLNSMMEHRPLNNGHLHEETWAPAMFSNTLFSTENLESELMAFLEGDTGLSPLPGW